MKDLNRISYRIQKKDFSVRVRKSNNAEVMSFVNNFNSTLSSLDKSFYDLAKKNRQLDAIIKSVSNGIIVIDINNRVYLINSVAREYIDYGASGRLEGMPISSIVKNEALLDFIVYNVGMNTSVSKEIRSSEGRTFKVKIDPVKMHLEKDLVISSVINIEDISERIRLEDPIVEKVLSYRQVAKLKSTYTDGLEAYIREDGRIHCKLNQLVTATGRLSSTEPNLQNIPIRMELGKKIRKAFIPKEGFVFVDADYSQIELRIMAHLSGDEELIKAYQSEEDIHRITASHVFKVPLDEVTDMQRRNAKAVNFGIIYGISSFGLGENLGISRKDAEKYINDYFKAYPKVKTYLDSLVQKGIEDGYVKTYFGRIRPIPELSSNNFMKRQFGERIAMNSPVQGTAADIIKIAMNNVNKRLKREYPDSKLLLQIHDELLIEAKEEDRLAVAAILKEEMMKAADLKVKLSVEVKFGYDWYDAH